MTAALPDETLDTAPGPLGRSGVLVLRNPYYRERRMLFLASVIAVGCFLILAAVAYFWGGGPNGAQTGATGEAGAVGRMTLPVPVADSAVIYDTKVMPIAPGEASVLNAERPLDVARIVPAAALRIAAESASGTGYAAALRCLTQAVYYEAASEPDEGQRGVAQVVLNRVRHPAFPNTVCGVVFQGSERVTGCQFSFTCDGSLARMPSVSGWARAERVARAALGGRVAAEVGNATHYHANYVVPYWAPTLDKAATIGAHIFYLMRGFLGSPRAFSSRYNVALEAPDSAPDAASTVLDGKPGLFEPPPAPDVGPLPNVPTPTADARYGDLITGSKATPIAPSVAATLRADETRGELKPGASGSLKIDEGARPSEVRAEPSGNAPR